MTTVDLERRFLEFVYTTDHPVSVTAFAFFAPASLEAAMATLDGLASKGTLLLEIEDNGDTNYVFPGRQRMPLASPAHSPKPVAAASNIPPFNPVQLTTATRPPPTDMVAVATTATGAQRECPFCGETILASARKCKHCSEFLDPALRMMQTASPVQVNVQNVQQLSAPPTVVAVAPRQVSAGTAALLSFLFPGLGQMYVGRVGSGLAWMIFTIIGYAALIVPGLILHVICIASAAGAANVVNEAKQLPSASGQAVR